jgi:hypothetical protein
MDGCRGFRSSQFAVRVQGRSAGIDDDELGAPAMGSDGGRRFDGDARNANRAWIEGYFPIDICRRRKSASHCHLETAPPPSDEWKMVSGQIWPAKTDFAGSHGRAFAGVKRWNPSLGIARHCCREPTSNEYAPVGVTRTAGQICLAFRRPLPSTRLHHRGEAKWTMVDVLKCSKCSCLELGRRGHEFPAGLSPDY